MRWDRGAADGTAGQRWPWRRAGGTCPRSVPSVRAGRTVSVPLRTASAALQRAQLWRLGDKLPPPRPARGEGESRRSGPRRRAARRDGAERSGLPEPIPARRRGALRGAGTRPGASEAEGPPGGRGGSRSRSVTAAQCPRHGAASRADRGARISGHGRDCVRASPQVHPGPGPAAASRRPQPLPSPRCGAAPVARRRRRPEPLCPSCLPAAPCRCARSLGAGFARRRGQAAASLLRSRSVPAAGCSRCRGVAAGLSPL